MTNTNAGPVLPQPAAWLIDWPEEPELGHYFGEEPTENGRSRPLFLEEHVAGPLREALSECATAVGAGVSSDCSVEFLRQVPREVDLVVARLRERVAELERLVELYRVQWVERDNCAWLAMQAECEARGAELDRLRAENESLSECLRECADDLEAEVKARGDVPRRIDRDLEPVRKARKLLAARAAREG